jgi:hypothetical protein
MASDKLERSSGPLSHHNGWHETTQETGGDADFKYRCYVTFTVDRDTPPKWGQVTETWIKLCNHTQVQCHVNLLTAGCHVNFALNTAWHQGHLSRGWRKQGPPAIAENPWSRSGQKMWILGLRAGGQSGQKATKFETAQSPEPGQDRRDVKCPKACIRT